MSLDRSNLKFKFDKVGGIKTLFSLTSYDFYFALLITLTCFTFMTLVPPLQAFWKDSTIVGILLTALFGLEGSFLVLLMGKKKDVRDNGDFNRYLEENGFLAGVEFLFDWPVFVLVIGITSLLIFIPLWYLLINHPGFRLFYDSFILISIGFTGPLFLFLYGLLNVYFAYLTLNYYNDLELRFLNNKKNKLP